MLASCPAVMRPGRRCPEQSWLVQVPQDRIERLLDCAP
jgi:hypothetical protein